MEKNKKMEATAFCGKTLSPKPDVACMADGPHKIGTWRSKWENNMNMTWKQGYRGLCKGEYAKPGNIDIA